MKIKELNAKELQAALPLVCAVFSEYEAKNYPEDGKKRFGTRFTAPSILPH